MILAILQARVSSSRLPGKVLLPLLGQPMLARQLERVRRARLIDTLLVATSEDVSDDPIEALCAAAGVACYRGRLDDVLDRYYQAALAYRPRHIVRLTGDCPLADPGLIDAVIAYYLESGCAHVSNGGEPPSFPDGLDVEVFSFAALETAWRETRLGSEREHVTPFIYKHPERFRLGQYRSPVDLSALRWTVDEAADFELISIVYQTLYPAKPDFDSADVLRLLEARPELKTINTRHRRNEGYAKSLRQDRARSQPHRSQTMPERYHHSEEMLARALQTIPLGTQTFSKSKTQFPHGVSPYFVQRAKGSQVWDVDGNQYVDFINSLAAVTLGYSDPDVTAAVKAQLEDGVIFSLPHPIEFMVAEKMREMVPCAQMSRFGKNGSDATAGAVRLARAFTGREHVAVCGYHGWQDWYIGSTLRNRGVPQATRELTHAFGYNDLASLERLFAQWPDQIAAVVMEPMNVAEPLPGFLAAVKELAHRHGALLVFDETITGFRYANGGAQEHFGVTPDLATFGKGVANGYPLSVVCGRADIMGLMEEIFFSFTFGGETLSLAAALATLNKLQRQPVTATLASQGQKVLDGVAALIARHRVGDVFLLSGHPSWSFLQIRDAGRYSLWQIKTLFLQEMFARGVLTLGSHNMSYAHTDADVAQLLGAYDAVFPLLRQAIDAGTLEANLRCAALEPLFKVR